jgi:hypothetical protein
MRNIGTIAEQNVKYMLPYTRSFNQSEIVEYFFAYKVLAHQAIHLLKKVASPDQAYGLVNR